MTIEPALAARLYELGRSMADHGGWEEFHARGLNPNFVMYDYHKGERLRLTREYFALKQAHGLP